jgi:hypothetical protein
MLASERSGYTNQKQHKHKCKEKKNNSTEIGQYELHIMTGATERLA